MIYTIDSLREEIFHNIYSVYEIFKDFFGEQNVDLQEEDVVALESCVGQDLDSSAIESLKNRVNGGRPFIMVHWPSVIVTNENGRSVAIQDLFAKIPIAVSGCIPLSSEGFQLNRSRYSKEQFVSDYMHSHISGIPYGDYTRFLSPCLGSGPIRQTILSLKTDNNTANWMLFCQELAMYVTVESLRGVPYRRLEQIGASSSSYPRSYERDLHANWWNIHSETIEIIKEFIPYYLEHGKFIFDYRNGSYDIGMPMSDIVIDMSNCFIKFFNSPHRSETSKSDLFHRCAIEEVIVKDGKFFVPRNGSNNSSRHLHDSGALVCTFKGNSINLQIDSNTEEENLPHTTIVLTSNIVNCILNNILKVINYRYGTIQTEEPRANQNVFYL